MSGETGSHITRGCQGLWACLPFQVEQESGERVARPRIAEMGSLPTRSPCSRSDKARIFSELPADRHHADAGRKILTQRNGRMLMCAVILGVCVCVCERDRESVHREIFTFKTRHRREHTHQLIHMYIHIHTHIHVHKYVYIHTIYKHIYTHTYT